MISHLGRYEIKAELGQGAMGVVYKAYDPLIERFVAIKCINLQSLTAEKRRQFEARFYQEAKAAGHLNHPNIVTIHDLGQSGDTAYIAMELMEGRELQHILDGAKRLSVEDALDLAKQVGSALAYAHQRGVVHRDIKPSNIMVLGDNQVKLVDFGIAKMATPLGLTQEGLVIGSPLYMSPEQILGKEVDARSDIFSLGVVLYQMLTWKRAFSADNAASLMYQIVHQAPPLPSALNPQVSGMLDSVVLKCLEKSPAARYQSARELEKDLRLCREELLRARMGLAEHKLHGPHFRRLKHLATPGSIPERTTVVASYVAMALIFVADLLTDGRNATIQMHLVYLFPLAMVGFHCGRKTTVGLAVFASLALQGIVLLVETLPVYARISLAFLFIPSDIFVVYLARVARENFLEVAKLSSHDGLTGLRNRLSFESIMETELAKQGRTGGVLSLAFIDLDNFKELNEARGYADGDRALKVLSAILQENARQSDTIARIGGDEFAILMPDTPGAECAAYCQELSAIIESGLAQAAITVTTSIGYASFDQPPASTSEVFLKAEEAMHLVQARRLADAGAAAATRA
jgi:diguanylate cyclase (GGDEF)-like protein